MSSYRGRFPCGYAPELVLSVRKSPEGGGVRTQVVQCPQRTERVDDLVLLVHGFNNHACEAAERYQAFRDRQYPLAGMQAPQLERCLGDFYWPGDAEWGKADLFDFAAYPQMLQQALDSAKSLAEYLGQRGEFKKIHFVGHSLGCRVVLECIREMLPTGQGRIGRVVLMAPAVPTAMVERGAELAAAVERAESVLVLSSFSDGVLCFSFPAGETLAGQREGVLPQALGRDGPPSNKPGNLTGEPIDSASHGDYWGFKPICEAASQKVADLVAQTLWPGCARPEPPCREVGAGRECGSPRSESAPSRGILSSRGNGYCQAERNLADCLAFPS